MKQYLLAHDLGTSGNKSTLWRTDGHLVRSIVHAYGTHYFNANWAEQNPQDWWRAVCDTTREILKGIEPQRIACVSFSGQMMGCVCVDENGEALRDAIIWADQRAKAEADEIARHISPERFYRISGHRNSPSYGLQKLMWIKNHEPDIYARTDKMLNAKDYIVARLTGRKCTEYTDATGTTALDINTLEWSDEIIRASGIDRNKLPELQLSTFSPGGVTAAAAQQTGLLEGTPVVMGGGDGLCAALGAGVISEGRCYSYVGSSAWISMGTKAPVFDDGMRTFNWVHIVPGIITPCGTMQSAGGSYSWLKREICRMETQTAQQTGEDVYEIINREIEASAPGANGILFLPYLLGERSPRWNPDAQGAFVGLKMESRREDILRAVMEGVTYNMRIILDVFRQHMSVDDIVVIGGGAKGATWRQMMADIYEARILKPVMLEEATSMGAAVTGGVGVGAFSGFDAIERFIHIDQMHQPNPDTLPAYRHAAQLFDECYRALEPFYKKLNNGL
jgi:xylulokinase